MAEKGSTTAKNGKHTRGRGRPVLEAEFDTREALLRAAHELLAERGSLQVSITDICERAGINVAMVHYHFGNKRGMLITLFERMCAKWAVELEHLMELDVKPTRKLELHVSQMIRNYRRAPYTTRLMTEVVGLSTASSARRLGGSFVKPLTDFYRQLIVEGVAAGEFREIDPEFLFFSIVGACEFFFSTKNLVRPSSRNRNGNESIEVAFGQHTIDMLLKGMVTQETTLAKC